MKYKVWWIKVVGHSCYSPGWDPNTFTELNMAFKHIAGLVNRNPLSQDQVWDGEVRLVQ